ncbi:MAG: hypothetical protein Q9227_000100 [Pyrenula ochraceoflavens]
MSNNYKFEGWMGLDKSSADGNMKWHSDLHTLRSGWAPANYPVVVGHEIVGKAVRVGPKAEGNIKIGDRVGVGAQSSSCLKPDCEDCSHNMEQFCAQMAPTFDANFPDGSKTYGGYANYWRGPSHFVVKIPDGIPSDEAAPMLCGGITTYSPLKRGNAGPGKKVGIIGIGGLGHFGILWAKALGCDKITAISRSASKKADALKMGADEFIATDEDKDWATHHTRSLDLLVSTVSSPNMPLPEYLQLLRTNGSFVQVGAPEDLIPPFNAFALIAKGVTVGGSAIGSPEEIREMLAMAEKKKVKAWIQKRPMDQANQAVVDMGKGLARYRYTLVNEKQL